MDWLKVRISDTFIFLLSLPFTTMHNLRGELHVFDINRFYWLQVVKVKDPEIAKVQANRAMYDKCTFNEVLGIIAPI